ncbi:MAG: hypothetical protein K2X97_20905 [Mycobacteriaceae bacterium]|nr:hypothetical protein [Mycobacteriaceae bacterium]
MTQPMVMGFLGGRLLVYGRDFEANFDGEALKAELHLAATAGDELVIVGFGLLAAMDAKVLSDVSLDALGMGVVQWCFRVAPADSDAEDYAGTESRFQGRALLPPGRFQLVSFEV